MSFIISDYFDTVCLNIGNILGKVLSKEAEYSDLHLDLSLNENGLSGLLLRPIIPLGLKSIGISIKTITLSAGEFRLLCQNIEKLELMLDQPFGLIESLLKPN